MIDINLIQPQRDGKYSPLLYKWMALQKRKGFPVTHVFQAKVDSLDGRVSWAGSWRARDLIIGRGDFFDSGEVGGIGGRSISAIITSQRGVKSESFWYSHLFGLRDITEEFWAEYLRVGRCAWDKDHRMSMVGDEGRWHYHAGGRGRRCQWCGAEQELLRERRVQVVETVTETWVAYKSSAPAVVSWPRGALGEAA